SRANRERGTVRSPTVPSDRASQPGSLDPSPARAPGWLAWAGPAALGTALPLFAVLASGRTLAWRDTARVFAPLRGLVVEALRDLRLPLWNPHEGTGMPLFAQVQHGVLQPVSLALAALWPRAGMDAFIVCYVLLAGVGAALLARHLGGSAGAAALAGLGYGLSGYVLSMSAVLPYLAGAAVAPWAVAALIAAEGAGGVALAGLAVAVLHFSGDPQWALAAALVGGALALEARGIRGLAGAGVAVALGTGLAAVQLVPAWAWLGETVRGQIELPQAERTQWALAPWRLLELAAPGFFQGTPGESLRAPIFQQLGREAAGRSLFASYDIPFVPSVFVGAGLLALAATASASRRGRVLAALAAAFLWTAMGRHLGAEQLLHAVPLWGQLRYAEKMVGPFTLCLALLAALGADRLPAVRIARGAAAAAAPAAVALAVGAILGAGWGEGALAALGLGSAAPLARWRLAVGLYHAAGALGALALLFLAAARRPGRRRLLAPGAAALVFAEGLAAAPFALHAGARGVREEDPLARLRGTAEVVRVGTPLRARQRQGPADLDEADRAVAVESRMGVTPYPASSRIDQIETYVATPPMGLMLAENAIRWSWVERRRYAVTHLVLPEPVSQAELPRLAPAVEGGRPLYAVPELGFRVWQVPHRPWAAFAERALPVADRGEAFRALQATPVGDGGGVILEGPAPGGLSPGRVLSVERRPEYLKIEAEAPGDGLLVVSDAFWPGWKARLDGRTIPLQRADVLVRAVAWPRGRHVLEMAYQPAEVSVGISITAAASLLALGLGAWAWVSRRRSHA
ncbi:MAG TPA: hypothetical protein VFI16_04560, partial [Anaeromyxobacteraceae bacterium]|nr:hypothetical protein [Anaeromyxobacteraceae bacterium]